MRAAVTFVALIVVSCLAADRASSPVREADEDQSDVDGDSGPECSECCVVGSDCSSGVCGVGNACPEPPCQCQVATCSDLVKNGDEDCDASDLGDASCESLGYPAGVLSCTEYCVFDVSECERCGDGVRDVDEECDPGDPDDGSPAADFGTPARTCDDEGLPVGTITACNDDCSVDVSGCSFCGDGIKNGTDSCDGDDLSGQDCISRGYAGGQLRCTSDCHFDEAECTGCSGECGSHCGLNRCIGGECVYCTKDEDCCAMSCIPSTGQCTSW